LDRSYSGTIVATARVFRSGGGAEFWPGERLGAIGVPDPVGPELCRLLLRDDIPLFACAVCTFFLATDDGLKGLLLGLVLGAVVFVPLTLMDWTSSGPDSGPPTESFWTFFLRWVADPMTAIFPLAGLVTAGLYWWLGTRRRDSRLPDFTSPQ
jgi:hypothetical protein